MPQRPALFRTVPEQDFLGFWPENVLRADKVARFLDLDRSDVARIAGVSVKSVRYDHKIPKEVLERLSEIAVVCGLVAQFFEGSVHKTTLWFQTPNSLLGGMSPRDMIRLGRYDQLRRFVVNALQESGMEPATHGQIDATISKRDEAAQSSAA